MKSQVKREIAEIILGEIENHTRAGISPVDGGEFAELSEKYKKKKQAMGKGGEPDLHLKNEMINSIKTFFKQDSVEFAITDSKQKKKAYNHNVGDTVPQRPFLPDDTKKGDQSKFAPDIINAINEALNAAKG